MKKKSYKKNQKKITFLKKKFQKNQKNHFFEKKKIQKMKKKIIFLKKKFSKKFQKNFKKNQKKIKKMVATTKFFDIYQYNNILSIYGKYVKNLKFLRIIFFHFDLPYFA